MKEKIKIILICIVGWLFIIQPLLWFGDNIFSLSRYFGFWSVLKDFFRYFIFPFIFKTWTEIGWSNYMEVLISWGIGIILINLILRKKNYERKNR
jgi:hypothetical protein